MRPIGRLPRALARVGVSTLFAGLFYSVWLAAFLGAFKHSGAGVRAVLWMVAPVVTAAGFAAGLELAHRWIGAQREAFSRAFVWALVGCVVGALAVVWFGPMLIVFGMFLVGTGSVALRELATHIRAGND
jgi:hypothetical protein